MEDDEVDGQYLALPRTQGDQYIALRGAWRRDFCIDRLRRHTDCTETRSLGLRHICSHVTPDGLGPDLDSHGQHQPHLHHRSGPVDPCCAGGFTEPPL
ncbi:MAG: hypothetical protein J2O47_10595 [Acidimicrobiaceae bacterium]|nr:hypothetical protein [Acidimicrobiaceae bacterium]